MSKVDLSISAIFYIIMRKIICIFFLSLIELDFWWKVGLHSNWFNVYILYRHSWRLFQPTSWLSDVWSWSEIHVDVVVVQAAMQISLNYSTDILLPVLKGGCQMINKILYEQVFRNEENYMFDKVIIK